MSELMRQASMRSKLVSQMRAKAGKAPDWVCLLLDVSYSMVGTPIANLRNVADKFPGVRKFTFSTECRELAEGEQIGGVEDSTRLTEALLYVKSRGIKHVVLVTDGDPDDEDSALKAAKGLKIDIFFVKAPPVPQFLYDLAKATGGECGNTSIDLIKELEDGIRGLLPPPEGGTIQL